MSMIEQYYGRFLNRLNRSFNETSGQGRQCPGQSRIGFVSYAVSDTGFFGVLRQLLTQM